jgi:hypothetical protein
VRDQRHPQKEVWLENTIPKMVEGSKAHSKRGRVGRYTSWDVRWLEGAFKEKEDMARKHTI